MPDHPVVFVVDDDPAVADALRVLISAAGYEVQTFASGERFLQRADGICPGCIVLDVRMPGKSGLELQQELKKRGVHTPIIFITGHGDVPMSVRAMQAGAVDFLEKPFDDARLLERIEAAIAQDLEQRKQLAMRRRVEARLARLTPREREVLERVANGQSNKQIARDLQVSPRTVEVHRARMMDKMDASNLPELIGMALVAGLVDPPLGEKDSG